MDSLIIFPVILIMSLAAAMPVIVATLIIIIARLCNDGLAWRAEARIWWACALISPAWVVFLLAYV